MVIVGQEINYSDEVMEQVNAMLQVQDYSKDGHCSDCGQCCTNMLPVNFQEISRIEKYIKKHQIQACKHFIPAAGRVGDMICPFRDTNEKRCTIYPVRPGACRAFFCGEPREKIVSERAASYRRCSLEIDMRATFFGGASVAGAYMRSKSMEGLR